MRFVFACFGLCACDIDTEFNHCPVPVVINEVMSASTNDWIELYNPGNDAVDLTGFRLSRTRDEVEFTIPAEQPDGTGGTTDTVLDRHEFLLLMADSFREGPLAAEHLVTGFDLNRDGDGVWLRASADDAFSKCDQAIYPDQHADFSWARQPDGGDDWCDASFTTPGARNAPCECESEGGTSPWC